MAVGADVPGYAAWDGTTAYPTGLAMFRAALADHPDRPLIHFGDRTLTVGEVGEQVEAIAAALADNGIGPDDRVAIQLQNVPEYAIAIIAAWRAGAAAVTVNPMATRADVLYLIADSGARAYIGEPAAATALGPEAVPFAATVDGTGPRSWPGLLARYAGRHAPEPALNPDSVALVTYTSGTTGAPKGAMNTHGNLVFGAEVYRHWARLELGDVVLAVAPLSHITGTIAHLAVSLLVPAPMVLLGRFDPGAALAAVERHQASFTVAAVTAFIAMKDHEDTRQRDLSSFRKVYSGGAPIPAAVIADVEARMGCYLHPVYGLTETTSPALMVPLGTRAPLDPAGAFVSVGLPVTATSAHVVDDELATLPQGETGELVISGPQVVPGYWRKPEETSHAFRADGLHTGDVGFADASGWYFVIDRKKDQINAAGFKIWPREVEDVLFGHPAVAEVSVVGVPDPYRGETVKAVVVRRRGAEVTGPELIAFARERLAAYKYPRIVEFRDELPKTISGKIRRTELR
jgi:long-chain acyl-CoA synthetase